MHSSEVTYVVSQKDISSTKRGALVDRGANGGLAGSDVRALQVTDWQVDIQGIDNHQLTNIPIVTAAGVVSTQCGPIVLIMHQYAHMKNGRTIHSSAQLESHGVIVDDRTLANDGHQRIVTQGGYVIPLSVRSSLVYMDIRPPTDAELSSEDDGGLPQVILTSDLDWVASSIDHEFDQDQWFDALEDIHELDYNIPFDDYGEYCYTHDTDVMVDNIQVAVDLESDLLINV